MTTPGPSACEPTVRNATVIADGTRLAVTTYPYEPRPGAAGSPREPVLLLHGLAGYAGEWGPLARLLLTAHEVVAYDARGHGSSDRRPPDGDLSRAAHARDAVAVIEQIVIAQIGLERPVLVGQSIGGVSALLAAAARPDLLRALVLVEASPKALDPDLPPRIGAWLDSWPIPFTSREAAAAFFGGGRSGLGWAHGLQEGPDGLRPRFDRDVMLACAADGAAEPRSYWPEWDRLECPVLVVRGDTGQLTEADAEEMRDRRPGTWTETVADAGHDVHLDRPEALHALIERFLDTHRPAAQPSPR
ncbi:alpha/beta fold hydrolase [Streptomyces sp. NBC_01497]|uniref:alpha/beta fold hydrolase n=1 Tax=Streptomyces sp. NBC_01497 TaxID=2903885 RepID=UPI002E32888D|nr:alpha/beta hydrolase [Streptomyces sp. NBC_01497]